MLLCREALQNSASGIYVDHNDAILYAGGVSRYTSGQRRTRCDAAFQVDSPAVQRTYHGCPGHDAVAQRTAFVGALIIDGQKSPIEVEYRDFDTAQTH